LTEFIEYDKYNDIDDDDDDDDDALEPARSILTDAHLHVAIPCESIAEIGAVTARVELVGRQIGEVPVLAALDEAVGGAAQLLVARVRRQL